MEIEKQEEGIDSIRVDSPSIVLIFKHTILFFRVSYYIKMSQKQPTIHLDVCFFNYFISEQSSASLPSVPIVPVAGQTNLVFRTK